MGGDRCAEVGLVGLVALSWEIDSGQEERRWIVQVQRKLRIDRLVTSASLSCCVVHKSYV